MLKKCGVVLVLILLAVLTAASASAVSTSESSKNTKPGNGGYVLGVEKSDGVSMMSTSGGYICQGETKWGYKTISGYVKTLGAVIWWGNPSNSLRVRIFTPDGYVLGPVYDNWDGVLDGKIPVTISREGGLAQGTYGYEIYGDRVSGMQYFTFS